MFEIGATYKLKENPPSLMPSFYYGYRDLKLKCIKKFGGRYAVLEVVGKKMFARTWKESWVDLIESPAIQEDNGCKCNLFLSGCSCGAMQKEMSEKNKVRCKQTKLWITKN